MPGQNTVVAQHYMDQYETVSFPLHGSTVTRDKVTPILYLEKDIVIDDIRIINRLGIAGLTLDVGFLPGAKPVGETWAGKVTTTATSTVVTITSTTTGSGPLSVGDRFMAADGTTTNAGFTINSYIVSFGTYTPGSGTGTVNINQNSASAVTTTDSVACAWKSVLTAPMSAIVNTSNTVVVGSVNANTNTVPVSAAAAGANFYAVTTPNNIVKGPSTLVTTPVLGNVIGILAEGAATTNYVGTLQIRYRTRIA